MPFEVTSNITGPIYFFVSITGVNQVSYPVFKSYSIDQLKNTSDASVS